jgi:hypothetical protein
MENKIQSILKNERTVKTVIIIGIAVIVFMLVTDFGGIFGNNSEKNNSKTEYEYEDRLERQIAELSADICGVSAENVRVMLTLKADGKEIAGIAIVCPNGEDINIQTRVTKAVAAALGIGTNRVSVV